MAEKWSNEDVVRLLTYFAPLSKRQKQMSGEQILSVASTIIKQPNPNVLVFGLGYDAAFLCACNPLGRTYFVENKKEWIDVFAGVFPPTASCHLVSYPGYLGLWEENMDYPEMWDESLNNIAWDIILVDGPEAFCVGSPGRQQSIWCASQLRHNKTHIYLHDYERPGEYQAANAYLKKPKSILTGAAGDLAYWAPSELEYQQNAVSWKEAPSKYPIV